MFEWIRLPKDISNKVNNFNNFKNTCTSYVLKLQQNKNVIEISDDMKAEYLSCIDTVIANMINL